MKHSKINVKSAERLKSLLRNVKDENGKRITQSIIADKIGASPEHLSFIANGKRPLMPELAESFLNAYFPDVNLSWLLGYNDIMTKSEIHTLYNEFTNDIDLAALYLLGYGFTEESLTGCYDESGNKTKEPPNNLNPQDISPEDLQFLLAQLKDYAVQLAWNYTRRKEQSAVWNTLKDK